MALTVAPIPLLGLTLAGHAGNDFDGRLGPDRLRVVIHDSISANRITKDVQSRGITGLV